MKELFSSFPTSFQANSLFPRLVILVRKSQKMVGFYPYLLLFTPIWRYLHALFTRSWAYFIDLGRFLKLDYSSMEFHSLRPPWSHRIFFFCRFFVNNKVLSSWLIFAVIIYNFNWMFRDNTINTIIVSIFCQRQLIYEIILLIIDIMTKVLFQDLILFFRLFNDL